MQKYSRLPFPLSVCQCLRYTCKVSLSHQLAKGVLGGGKREGGSISISPPHHSRELIRAERPSGRSAGTTSVAQCAASSPCDAARGEMKTRAASRCVCVQVRGPQAAVSKFYLIQRKPVLQGLFVSCSQSGGLAFRKMAAQDGS